MINIRTVQKTRAFTFRARLVVVKNYYTLNPLAVCYAEVLKLSQSGRRVKRTKYKDDDEGKEGKEEQNIPLERFP